MFVCKPLVVPRLSSPCVLLAGARMPEGRETSLQRITSAGVERGAAHFPQISRRGSAGKCGGSAGKAAGSGDWVAPALKTRAWCAGRSAPRPHPGVRTYCKSWHKRVGGGKSVRGDSGSWEPRKSTPSPRFSTPPHVFSESVLRGCQLPGTGILHISLKEFRYKGGWRYPSG